MDWCRLWHGSADDPKWRTIAKKAGVRTGDVWAVFCRMMLCASENEKRGTIAGWDDEDHASALDFEADEVRAIREAMQGKILDGDALTGWQKRQVFKEDRTAAERKRREREKNKKSRDDTPVSRHVTPCHAPDTDTDTDKRGSSDEEPLSSGDDDLTRAYQGWQQLADEIGLPRIRSFNVKRRSQIRARLKDASIDDWFRALDVIRRRPDYYREQWAGGHAIDIEAFCRPGNFDRILNDFYRDAPERKRTRFTAAHAFAEIMENERNRQPETGPGDGLQQIGTGDTGPPRADVGSTSTVIDLPSRRR